MNFGGHFTTHHADVGTVGYSLTGDDSHPLSCHPDCSHAGDH